MKGNIRKTEHVVKAKIFEGIAFRYRLAKAKANKFYRTILNDTQKATKEIEADVQRLMRKCTSEIIDGTVFVEDWQDISEAVFEHCKKKPETE